MKALLLGANGMLGRDLLDALQRSPDITLTAATRTGTLAAGGVAERVDLDVDHALARLLDRIRPELIINAAAYTAVDRAEGEESQAMRINRDVPARLGCWAAAHRALVVHYSTDYVFDGAQVCPYTPLSVPHPLGAYGRSKLAGEQALQHSGAAHLIFRTAWLYGRHGRNFPATMLKLAAERETLRVVDDQYGTPTSTRRVASSTLAGIDHWLAAPPEQRMALQGIHHLVADGSTTWHGFATAVIEYATATGLLTHRPLIEAVDTAAFPTVAQRPRHGVLDNRDFRRAFGVELPPWQQDVETFVGELSAGAVREA